MSITSTSAAEALRRLEREAEDGRPAPRVCGSLPLKNIHTAEAIFQPRWGINDPHVVDLAKAVRSAGGALAPIIVWWSGLRWYVIDGHHRMKAYRLHNETRSNAPVTETPVEVFLGSAVEAHARAVEANSRNHLRMEVSDKTNAAWRMVCLADGGGVGTVVARATGIARQTVAKMQKHHQELRERWPGSEPLDMSWKQAMDLVAGRDPKEWGDDEKQEQAREWANRLREAGGDKFAKAPDIFAMTLEVYAHDLIPRLVASEPFQDAIRRHVETMMALGEWDPEADA